MHLRLPAQEQEASSKPEISDCSDNSSEHSTCQSNDSEGSCGNTSEHSFKSESESISVPNEMSTSRTVNANGPQGRPKPVKAWVKVNWEDFEEFVLGDLLPLEVAKAHILMARVTKPQNKTPYELLFGHKPIISYIRPFGCHVTILDTLSVLGKFDEKSDEGFLVGTSEITNNAGTSQTPNSNASEEKDEDVELIVVPSAVMIPEEKVESRTSSIKSKKEKILTDPQQEKKVSSTNTLEDNPTIQAFRREFIGGSKLCRSLHQAPRAWYATLSTFSRVAWMYMRGTVDSTSKTSSLNTVKRIFKYLKGKPNLGLWYPRESPFDLEAFFDSDYDGSNLDRKSITGGCQFLGQRLISWQCKKQTIVATLTTKAEYVATANCCGQVLWVQNQLLDYGFNFMNTKIHIDNESTICIVKNPVYHSKTKHIEIRHHFIRDCYEKKLISVEKIHTNVKWHSMDVQMKGRRDKGLAFVHLQYILNSGFAEIVDFLRGSNLRYALTSNPTIYDSLVKQFWQTATANTIADGTLEIKATIDTIGYTITEASIRDTLQLEDATGITMLPNDEIFEGMGQMGYPTDGTFTFWKSFFTPQWRYLVHHLLHCISSKSGGWDQFGSNIATALIFVKNNMLWPQTQPSSSHTPSSIYIFITSSINLHLTPIPCNPFLLPSLSLLPIPSPKPIMNMNLCIKNCQPRNGFFKQTKLTMGNAIVKLVKKVKKLEGLLKKRNVVLSDSEEEEPEAQGRKSQDDPLDSLVQGLVTPSTTKVNASGEEQVEDISPNTLEAAKTLSRVASLKPKSIDKGRRYKRRKETKGKKVVSSLDFQEEVDTGAEQVNTAEGVNTGSIKLSTVSEQVSTGSEQVSTVSAKKSTPSPDKGQRAGKAPMIIEETPKKSKEQILQEEASLAEAIRLDTLQKEEVAKQHYTDEDWDLIRAKIEANAELSKSMLGSDLQGEDFAKKMVDLVNQRKKYFAEERARAKRNKPMTQSQLKTYMMNYLKNQGTWKLSQLKNLSFEEVKKEFDKIVKQVESFAPINFEATKASLKRFGEELQTKTSKRLKSNEAKDV
ncbi:hypothetical protein Tco_0138631 [Tanacetum coccineum]